MLLALWPAFVVPRLTIPSGRRVAYPVTQRADSTPAIIAAEAHLQRLEAERVGTSTYGVTDSELAAPSLPDSNIRIGGVAVGVLGYVARRDDGIPEPFGASVAESDALPSDLNAAMMVYAARQATDEDDEAAIIAILLGRLI